ncbi:MAG: hypothetical protein K0Q72_645 [Armatimonadetes bacterium]|jgi:hypothetical protein|nr:hypothetical protein [Armatimonadota bacterium]
MAGSVKELGAFYWRLLTFRASGTELENLGPRHLALGLFCTWIVGMGRWWDDPEAGMLQHLGGGSLIYVLLLAGVLWLVVLPLRPRKWSYRGVLTYVSLTAAPALLYAIPVERWLEVTTAAQLNLGFLVVVAVWRVWLWVAYVRRTTGLSGWDTFASLGLPLMAVIVALTFLNLERGVIQIMAGLRAPTAEDMVGEAIFILGALSVYGVIPALLLYCYQVFVAADAEAKRRESGGE